MYNPAYEDSQLKSAYSTWFGALHLDQEELNQIRERVRVACADADILGLPTRCQYDVTERYGRVFRALIDWGLPSEHQLIADANIHWYLQFSGAMADILRNCAVLGVIGCRDIEAELRVNFQIGKVMTWIVRGENSFPGSASEPHWPDGFHRVMDSVKVVQEGQPFLIGAGVLGKIYCQRVKELGGVAIDVGSVIDAWAGVDSRLRFPRFRELFSIDRANRLGPMDRRSALLSACEEAGIKEAVF
jgi:hypothetical protein